jgi:hypothetical protein
MNWLALAGRSAGVLAMTRSISPCHAGDIGTKGAYAGLIDMREVLSKARPHDRVAHLHESEGLRESLTTNQKHYANL